MVDCKLCTALEKEEHLAYFTSDNEMGDGDTFYILPTKDKKGHEHRYMVVNKLHGYHDSEGYPTPHVKQDGMNLLFQFMLQFGKNFTIMQTTHASIRDHWHLVASDLPDFETTAPWDVKEEDLQLIRDTDRIEVTPKKKGEEIGHEWCE